MPTVQARVRADATTSTAIADGCVLRYEIEILGDDGRPVSVEFAELRLAADLQRQLELDLRGMRSHSQASLPALFALLAIEALRGATFEPGAGFELVDVTPKHLNRTPVLRAFWNDLRGATDAFPVVASSPVPPQPAPPPPSARPAGTFPRQVEPAL